MTDIGPLDWEETNLGTAYIVTSRVRTIGNPTADNPYTTGSALYFDCPTGTQRFEDVLLEYDGRGPVMVEKEGDG